MPAGDLGFWQGAYRDRTDPGFEAAREAVVARRMVTVDLLYGDHEGGQRTITRFALIPEDDGGWVAPASAIGTWTGPTRADPGHRPR